MTDEQIAEVDERRRAAADDRGRDRPRLQPAGRRRAEAAARRLPRDLPRQDHQLERPEDRRGEPGRDAARHADHRRRPLGRSGTTFNFTSHLAAINADFKAGPGAGTSVQWPASDKIIKAPKNDGITATVMQTPGAIGYIEYGYAKLTGTPMAILQNNAGEYVAAGRRGRCGGARLAPSSTTDARLHHRPGRRRRLPDRDLHLDGLLQARPGPGEGRRRSRRWSSTASPTARRWPTSSATSRCPRRSSRRSAPRPQKIGAGA